MSDYDNYFTVLDVVMLVATLAVAACTGIYFAYHEKKLHAGVDAYFHGNRRSSPIVVGLSLTLTFVSGMTTIGYPVEVYLYGTVWLWLIPCFPIVVAITSIYFIPIFYNLKLNCVYEYLEIRFCKTARVVSSVFVTLNLIFYMSVTICYPALSLVALTPITLHWSIALTCAICTFYTVIGGFLSVIWTDAFQSVIMFVGSMAVCIQTTLVVGGPSAVYESTHRGNRSTLLDFTTDVTKRSTVWSILIGNIMSWLVTMTTNQTHVQRYLSCSSITKARQAVLVGLVPQVGISFFAIATGAAAFAYFETCDPLLNGEITKNDQMIPLLVAKITMGVPGLSGLFVATVYAGTLSSVSSGINSTTLMIMEDLVGKTWKRMPERRQLLASKICGLVIGVLLFAVASGVNFVSGNLVQIGYTLASSFVPPVTGMFVLGMFCPWANSIGALTGAVFGFISVAWLSIGSLFFHDNTIQQLPRSTDGCNNYTMNGNISVVIGNIFSYNSSMVNQTTSLPHEQIHGGFSMYDISYLYFRFVGFAFTIIVGLVVSILFGKNDPAKMDPRLFVPLISSSIFPKKMRTFMRFGVSELPAAKPEKNELLETETK